MDLLLQLETKKHTIHFSSKSVMNIKKHIPNAITSLNLLSGFLGIIFSFENLEWASYMIFLAAIFDFFDGFAARLLKVASPIGKELDSMADMVSFGVLPGLIVFHLIGAIVGNGHCYESFCMTLLPYIGAFIPVFSGLRLAKFNIDTRQSLGFIGLPTPANAIFFAAFPFIINSGNYDFLANEYLLAVLAIVMSFLLVAELPLLALKFKSFAIADNKDKYLFLIGSLVLLIFLGLAAFPLIILWYIIVSGIFYDKNRLG
jgi:CDP-diacylglycerol--serine O-phosphatidyltransferase